MRKLLLALLLGLPAVARANPYYSGPTISTVTGTTSMWVSGIFYLAASSQTSSTPTITFNGITGSIVESGGFVITGTMTVQGNAFSVGTSTFAVTQGRVGIGTRSPATSIDVNGNAQFGSTAKSTFSTSGSLALDTNATLQLGTTFYVNNGRVGIGTTSPTQRLDIGGSSPNINLASGGAMGWGGSTFTEFIAGNTGTHAITFETNSTVAMTLNSSGYLGIGNTSPSYLLDVSSANGNGAITSTTGTNAAYLRFVNTSGNGYIGNQGSVGNELVSTGGVAYSLAVVAPGSNRSLQFATNATARLTLDSSGFAGINTTITASTLAVGGRIESISGGFKYPDGTVQITASSAATVASSATYIGSAQTVNLAATTQWQWWSAVSTLTITASGVYYACMSFQTECLPSGTTFTEEGFWVDGAFVDGEAAGVGFMSVKGGSDRKSCYFQHKTKTKLTAASHTFSPMWYSPNGGTLSLNDNSDTISEFEVHECP